MLLYRRPVSSSSPLRHLTLDSPQLAQRIEGRGAPIASALGLCGSFLILFVIAALRYGIGTDYWARNAPLFAQIRQGDSADYEQGFVLINRVVGVFTDDHQWLFAVMSFATIGLYYRFIVRMSLNPALSVFVFVFGGFYLESFNLVQQSLAIAILLNTLELAMRRKPAKFLIITLIAVTVHSSAFVWFAVWPLMWVRAGRVTRIALTVGLATTILVAPQALGSLVEEFAPEYAWYFGSDYGRVRPVDPSVLGVALLVFAWSAALVGRSSAGDRYADTVVNLLGVSVVLLLATVSIAYAFVRVNYYFSPMQILAVPLLLSMIRDGPLRNLVTSAFMAVYAVAFYYQFIVWNAHGVMPYDSIFSR